MCSGDDTRVDVTNTDAGFKKYLLVRSALTELEKEFPDDIMLPRAQFRFKECDTDDGGEDDSEDEDEDEHEHLKRKKAQKTSDESKPVHQLCEDKYRSKEDFDITDPINAVMMLTPKDNSTDENDWVDDHTWYQRPKKAKTAAAAARNTRVLPKGRSDDDDDDDGDDDEDDDDDDDDDT